MVDMAGCGPGSENEFGKLIKLKHFSDLIIFQIFFEKKPSWLHTVHKLNS